MDTTASRTFHLATHLPMQASRVARVTKRALLFAALCIGATSIGTVQAIGLDEIVQQSGLGEPLRLVIPLLTNASDQLTGEEFAGECFKVVPATANDLPQLQFPRVALEHRGGRAFVVVSTAYPINEPIMRVAVQAGCRVSMSREYTLLFDPISIEAPVVAAETAAPAEVLAPAPAAAVAPPEPRPVVQSSVVPRSNVASAARPKVPSAPRRATNVVAAPARPVDAPAAKASDRPRLQVSRSVGGAGAAPVAASAATKAAAEREALKAMEEETVVLQRRIAELSVTMERMDQELKAARAAKAEAEQAARVAAEQAARAAAEKAAAATPWSVLRAWTEENWLLAIAFAALIVLIVALLLSKRRRPVLVAAPVTATQADAFNPMDLGEPSVPGTSTVNPDGFTLEPEEDRTVPSVVPRVATPAGLSRVATPATGARAPTPPAAEPAPVPDFKYGPDLLFDYDVEQAAEESSAYSTLEREQPGIIAKLTSTWGTPEAAVRLEHYILTPRRGGRTLSRNAIAELKLLQAIAAEHTAGHSSETRRPGDAKSWKM